MSKNKFREPKYSPAPWPVPGKYVHNDSYNAFSVLLINGTGKIEQKVYGASQEKARANAVLVSKAPEMYETIKKLTALLENSFHIDNEYQLRAKELLSHIDTALQEIK